LIIFMVTAPMMVQGVDVSLPEATSKPLASEKEPVARSVLSAQKQHIRELCSSTDDIFIYSFMTDFNTHLATGNISYQIS